MTWFSNGRLCQQSFERWFPVKRLCGSSCGSSITVSKIICTVTSAHQLFFFWGGSWWKQPFLEHNPFSFWILFSQESAVSGKKGRIANRSSGHQWFFWRFVFLLAVSVVKNHCGKLCGFFDQWSESLVATFSPGGVKKYLRSTNHLAHNMQKQWGNKTNHSVLWKLWQLSGIRDKCSSNWWLSESEWMPLCAKSSILFFENHLNIRFLDLTTQNGLRMPKVCKRNKTSYNLTNHQVQLQNIIHSQNIVNNFHKSSHIRMDPNTFWGCVWSMIWLLRPRTYLDPIPFP